MKGMERLCRRAARVRPEGPAPMMAILGWEGDEDMVVVYERVRMLMLTGDDRVRVNLDDGVILWRCDSSL